MERCLVCEADRSGPWSASAAASRGRPYPHFSIEGTTAWVVLSIKREPPPSPLLVPSGPSTINPVLLPVELAELDRNVAISIRCHCVHVDWRRESPKLRNCQDALGHLNRVGAQGCSDARFVSFYCHRSVTWPSCAMLELTAQPCPQTTIVCPSYPRSCWTTEALPSSASVSLSSTS